MTWQEMYEAAPVPVKGEFKQVMRGKHSPKQAEAQLSRENWHNAILVRDLIRAYQDQGGRPDQVPGYLQEAPAAPGIAASAPGAPEPAPAPARPGVLQRVRAVLTGSGRRTA